MSVPSILTRGPENVRSPAAPAKPARRSAVGLTLSAQRRVCEHIEGNLDGRVDLHTLAGIAGLSLSHFARVFKQSQGITPHRYIIRRRLAKAKDLMSNTDLPLSAVALESGFSDHAHLSRCFREEVGISPREFRSWNREVVARDA